MRADVIELRDGVCKGQCPVEALGFVTLMVDQTHRHYLGSAPGGEDYLAALVGLPAHWLVPVASKLSWGGMDTSHPVVDAEGRLTGERVWLEDPVEDDVRPDEFCLVPHPDYEEVQIGICDDGGVVMYPSCGEHPGNVWRSYPCSTRSIRARPRTGKTASR